MVQLSPILAGLAIIFSISAAPLTVPLGTSGRSATISEDGGSMVIAGQRININQAIAHSDICKNGGKASGNKGHGKGNGAGVGGAASTNAKAIYFITNAAKNSIVALKVAADGTLSDGSVTATGGAGMTGVDSKGAPAVPDALFSQGAVKVAGNVSLILLKSMFNTDQYRPWLPLTLDQTRSRCLI